jgi:hypothetical protein
MPMSIALWGLRVAEYPHFPARTIRVGIYLLRHADQSGMVGTDENGRPIAEPRRVAAELGLGESTVFKALSSLNEAGFISFHKASTPEKFRGVTGRVRLNLTDTNA